MSAAKLDKGASLDEPHIVTTRYWHQLANGKLQCDLCPRACQLQPGQRGMCFVRARLDDQVVMTSYGRSSGFCMDPIEKKPLNHFYPGSAVLSFGTAGCNLACKFCQNWDISKSRQMDRLMDQASPEAIAIAAEQAGCRSVAFTYNDPVIFIEYAIDVAKACQQRDIATVAVTAGYICEPARADFFAHIDAVNIDLKAFNNEFYYQLCGAELAPVLETIRYVYHQTSSWLELTCLVIPGHNDSEHEIRAMSRWIVEQLGPEVPLHLTAFHPDYKMRDIAPTSLQSLQQARQLALAEGLYYVYCGNVRDPRSATSYCPQCQRELIVRQGYQIAAYQLSSDGRCPDCQARFHGRLAAGVGHWSGQRQAVTIIN
jgi:pyruvate formate lyase activating enzyme